jgi:hypothetical protein
MAIKPTQQVDPLTVLTYGRIGLGLALMAAPSATSLGYLGRSASHPTVKFVNRVFGGRDVALGAWALLARDDKRAYRQAITVGAACDAWDALAALSSRDGIPRWAKPLVFTTAVAAAVTGAVGVLKMND